ncbi:MAG: polysaccharide pyruvyl transferase CsaB [Synergistaceae bacterium]|jgi:polysaccharide pyruvyl transferase CsaB|nr:polysaccharide pyruvyl transferase CsaB [Synergistaceae bacterium]
MRPRRASFDVLLAGYFGFGNLGDEMLALAAVDNLNCCGIQKDKIAILSNDPGGSRMRLGIEAFDRWNASSVLRALGSSRSLMLAGGGLFQDSTSVRSCVWYWGLVRAARLLSASVIALGQSVGPLSSPISKAVAKNAFRSCRYVAVRDASSARALSEMKVSCEIMPDLAMSLSLPEHAVGRREAILINVRPAGNGDRSASAVLKSARALASMGEKLLCAAMSDEDAQLMKKYQMSRELPPAKIVTPQSLEEFAALAAEAKAAVGMRLHFGILSALAGLGVALSPYDPKVSSFADEWGIKLLKTDGSDENFDIIKLLTNSPFRDKRKFEKVRLLVAAQFDIARSWILGEENGRSKARRA